MCIFCRLAKKENLLLEIDHFSLILDDFPVTPGHALLIPKRHIVTIEWLTTEEWRSLQIAIQKWIEYIKQVDLIQHYTLALQNTKKSETSHRYCTKALETLKRTPHPTSFNHWINDGIDAGRTVHHLHRHIIPRYVGDMKDPRWWVRYVIPEMWNYKTPRT